MTEAHKRWINDKGDQTLRLNYPLTEDSVVFDVGGFKGEWSKNIYNKHKCTIHVFEPVKSFYKKIEAEFKTNPKVFVYNFGLGSATRSEIINLIEDGSSLFRDKGNKENVKIVNFNSFIEENNISYIDLIKINIEGGEYELLKGIIDNGNQDKINHYQVQFHKFIPSYEEKYKDIKDSILNTHDTSYTYEFIWDGWHKKNQL